MSPKTKASLKTVSIALVAIGGVFTVASGATRFVNAAVGVVDHRYVQRDTFNVYQAGQAERDKTIARENARRDSLLSRVDARVGAMYCGSLPLNKRAGCQ